MEIFDPNTPWFTQREYVDVISPDVDNDTFQQWLKREHVVIQDMKPGRGKIRKLSFAECAQINAFAFMTRAGERPQWSSRLCEKLVKERAADIARLWKWDLDSWEGNKNSPFLMMAFSIWPFQDEGADEAKIRAALVEPSMTIDEVRDRLNDSYTRVFDLDYHIWRTWHQIDQYLPDERIPWLTESRDSGVMPGADEHGYPLDPNHPWNKED